MRDIRDDLQDRANFLKEQIEAAKAQFDKHVGQIKKEHDSSLEGLKADLDAVNMLIGAEGRRLANTPSAPRAQPQPQASIPQPPLPQRARPRLPFAEMIGLQQRVG